MERLGVKTRTTPFHPQFDGTVERHNHTINNYLSLLSKTISEIGEKLVLRNAATNRPEFVKSTTGESLSSPKTAAIG